MTRIAIAVALLLVACTRENKEFCCTSAADCASAGLSEDHRDCNEGLACVDHSCAPASCATEGCAAAAPTCDVTIDVCAGCTSSSECKRFPSAQVCDSSNGGCVECLVASDCADAKPVCDNKACRTCKLDGDCASGACAEDGTCVAEPNAVYMAPLGVDAVPCSKAQPCKSLAFARNQTSSSRNHIVLATGTYVDSITTFANSTTATFVSIHGGNSTLKTVSDDGFVQLQMPSLIREIVLENTSGAALEIGSAVTVKHVLIRGGSAAGSSLLAHGTPMIDDLEIYPVGCGIQLSAGSLTIKRAKIIGGTYGICANGPAVVNIENLLVGGASNLGLDIPSVSGTISFSTIAKTGGSSTGVAGIRCTLQALQLNSIIVYTPDATSRPTIEGGCVANASIASPTSFPGAMNVDPVFVGLLTGDFHISGGSPAKDAVNAGPAVDVDGEARPRGARFDIGADEAQ